jgi:L-fucose isomerase-like protein
MNKRNLRPVELGLVVCSREFFNAAPALETRKQLLAQLDRLNIGYITMPVDATKNGAVQSRDDARRYAAYFRERRDHVDGLVVCLPNFGDEIAISELVNEARLNVPILLQASNDEIDKVDVKSRRDAFCGKISVTNNFYQYGVPWTDTATHTCDVDSAEFAADLDGFVRICRVVRGLKRARIGSIGARTGAFQTMRFSEKLLQAAGLTVVTVDLSEIIFAAGSKRTTVTPAPSSAGAAFRTISAAPLA